MKQTRTEYAEFIFKVIESRAWALQQDLAGHPQFAPQVDALDTIMHACTQARAALAMAQARDQLEDMQHG